MSRAQLLSPGIAAVRASSTLLLALLSFVVAGDAHAALTFAFENATVKVRQDAVTPERPAMRIKAARNEFEPFQLVIKNAGTAEEDGLDVEISDFAGPAGATISSSNVTIMLEQYLDITHKSDDESALGEWPDILVPKVDAYYHERRSFFPFAVAAGRIQPTWFDFFVPDATPAGDYTATVTVTQGASTLFTGTVTLTVWGFSLPATSSFRVKLGLSSSNVHYGHYGDIWKQPAPMALVSRLQKLYMRAALRHRITTDPMPMQIGGWDPATKKYGTLDNVRFKDSLVGFFGDADPGVEYGQSQFTSLLFDISPVYQKYAFLSSTNLCANGTTEPPQEMLDETRARVQAIYDLLTPEQRRITAVLPIDEPGGGEVGCGASNRALDMNSTKAMAQIVHEVGLKVRVTKRRVPELLDPSGDNLYVDTWVVPFDALVGKNWSGEVNTRAEYDQDIAEGTELWWYQGCNTSGCAIQGDSMFDGYIQYLVEFQGERARVFPWLAFKFDVSGELYWGSVGNYYLGELGNASGDPWYSLWNRYMANGEGTFFYPGVVDRAAAGLPYTDKEGRVRGAHTPSIGGTHDIPIESFRLKMIREGLEDYEYMKRLKDLNEEAFARAVVSSVATNTYTFSSDADDYYAAREAMAQKILEVLGAVSCGDATCSPSETHTSCPQDCATITPTCGDGACADGESAANCPQDCAAITPACGDGACADGESAADCPEDCAATTPACGDGACASADETQAEASAVRGVMGCSALGGGWLGSSGLGIVVLLALPLRRRLRRVLWA